MADEEISYTLLKKGSSSVRISSVNHNLLITWRPLYCLVLLFQILTKLPLALFVALFLWWSAWLQQIWCVTFYLTILCIYTCTPVLEGPFSLLNAARCQLTEVLCYYSDLISHTQTKTCNTHGASRLTHQYTNIDIY